ncbi:MAG: hypothetical protein ACXU7H_06755 [Burkholderiaceae bacterium]
MLTFLHKIQQAIACEASTDTKPMVFGDFVSAGKVIELVDVPSGSF